MKRERPEKYEAIRRANFERINRKRKKISDLPPVEAKTLRTEWRDYKRRYRNRKRT